MNNIERIKSHYWINNEERIKHIFTSLHASWNTFYSTKRKKTLYVTEKEHWNKMIDHMSWINEYHE
jgi:hypothetical protein